MVQFVNAAAKVPLVRTMMESTIGVHRDAWLPEFTSKTFRKNVPASKTTVSTDGKRTKGKVAIFSTCYVNYNEPGIGFDLTRILDHNDIAYVIVEKEACCGMPNLNLAISTR